MEPHMALLGFKKSFSRQLFTSNKDQDFIVDYSLGVIDRFNMAKNKAGIVIEPSIDIHNTPIEKVYARITTRKIGHVLQLRTIGNLLAELRANPSGKYQVRNQSLDLFLFGEEDIDATAKKLIDYFKKDVLPYIEKYATWKGLDDILNNNLSFNTVHCLIEPERSIRGLILAKLTGRKDLDELIVRHSDRIRSMSNENSKIELNRLLEILDSLPVLDNEPI